MDFRPLDELARLGFVERVSPNPERVRRWVERSRQDIRLAEDVVAGRDATRAVTILYEAGYRAGAGLLDLAGYRVRSMRGHHRACIEAAGSLVPSLQAALRGLDRFRRYRNATLYDEALPPGDADVADAGRCAGAVVAELELRVALDRA